MAPYTVRARNLHLYNTSGVEKIKAWIRSTQFNIKTIPDRLKEKGDLFKPVLSKGAGLGRKSGG